MEMLLSYIYKTWRLSENGYAMLSIGIFLGLCLIVGIVVGIIKNGKGDVQFGGGKIQLDKKKRGLKASFFLIFIFTGVDLLYKILYNKGVVNKNYFRGEIKYEY